ncbi:TonB-dependent receptor [Elizabethkingia meningoseptica]|uniref:SusC/RagA family TonB-linked outer membrane protein n=1 Tax=Elizabethkingia meningoseptica TaxID=238 RepID=UPI0022F1D259|nr:TonB-dependent receptor [Elizabethkingia meningoseptica]EJK5327310.1 TonB-dependent receptor [Elizabethkingia meningoseptica]WBS74541.1 TonB-dependent receptor [Elizabethkingia meningoseptica]
MKASPFRASYSSGVAIAFFLCSFSGVQMVRAQQTPSKKVKQEKKDSTNKTKDIDEVVIVGYGKQKKVNLTGAVASVSAKQLESRPIANLGQGLQGLIPNLNINVGSGKPGQGSTFNIRGTTSINGGDPLILVDNVQMDPNLINPADVATVTVLKDAASTAIYGVRGAFGVVLITTKTGKKNAKIAVNYTYDYTLSRPTKIYSTMNSVDYIKSHMEASATGAASGTGGAESPFTAEDLRRAEYYLLHPTPENAVYVDPGNPRLYRYTGNTDWAKAMYPSWAQQMSHNLSLSGGSDKTSYYTSLGYLDQAGTLAASNQKYQKYNILFKLDSELAPWLDVNTRITFNRTDNNDPAGVSYGSAEILKNDLRPIMPIKHPDGHYSGQGGFTNPFAILEYNGRNITKDNDIWLTGGVNIKPVKHVNIIADYTWNNYTYNRTTNTKAFNEYGANSVLLGVYPWTTPARVTEENFNDRYQAINAYAQYENTFGGKHYVKAMVGYNQELKQFKSFSASVKNLINQDMPSINLNYDQNPLIGGGINDWAVAGTFSRINYVYDEKYLFEVNGRYDGTSRFAREHRYSFQPSASVGWRISKEGFFQPITKIMNEFKIRASYGTSASQNLGRKRTDNNYPYLATMGVSLSDYIFGTEQKPYVGAPGLVRQDFTWEKVTSQNIGVDFSFLQNKLSGSFDYYIRDTKNMLYAGAALPAVLGTGVPLQNSVDLRNKGFELSLFWKDKIGKDFRYSVTLGLSDYQAKITRFSQNPNGNIGTYYVGQKLGEIWGYETDGYFKTDEEAQNWNQKFLFGGKWLAGDIKFKDLNGDGKIDAGDNTLANPGDRKIIGNSTPRYMYSMNLDFQYKNFDFTVFLQGVGKSDRMMGGNTFWGYTSEWDVPTEAHVGQFWTPDNPNAYFPRLRFGGGGNFQSQTKYLQNAAYLRVKQITLGYTLPQEVLESIKLKHLRLYITGQNLFTITNMFKNFDPELVISEGTYPISKSISFGAQLRF